MNSENIFDIWRFLGKGTPFVVRRNGWYHLSYMVTRVKPKGHYGEAYGYRLTDGKPGKLNLKKYNILYIYILQRNKMQIVTNS